jgi:hypothetical protein
MATARYQSGGQLSDASPREFKSRSGRFLFLTTSKEKFKSREIQILHNGAETFPTEQSFDNRPQEDGLEPL